MILQTDSEGPDQTARTRFRMARPKLKQAETKCTISK